VDLPENDSFEHIELDRSVTETVHYANEPRIRLLAQARWRLNTGGSREEWLALGKDHHENLIPEARDWVRAAIAAGILEPPKPNPTFALYDEWQDEKKNQPTVTRTHNASTPTSVGIMGIPSDDGSGDGWHDAPNLDGMPLYPDDPTMY
jgi:hypothetical protein